VVVVVNKYGIWLIMTPANYRDLEALDVIVWVFLIYIVISHWNSVLIIIEIFALQKFHWLYSFTVVKRHPSCYFCGMKRDNVEWQAVVL
jgi:hypothetical protein